DSPEVAAHEVFVGGKDRGGGVRRGRGGILRNVARDRGSGAADEDQDQTEKGSPRHPHGSRARRRGNSIGIISIIGRITISVTSSARMPTMRSASRIRRRRVALTGARAGGGC